MRYNRILDLSSVLNRKGLFLFGPRLTGKTDYLKTHYPDAHYVDLLRSENYNQYLTKPELFRKHLRYLISKNTQLVVIVDEIQRLPNLLNEIHILIEENKEVRFILTGSSSRKLKRSGVNLLGGRVSSQYFFPISYQEMRTNFDLEKVLSFGALPSILNSKSPQDDLQDYVQLYLNEEIKAEALVRNLVGFAEFLKLAATSVGEQISFTSFANDAQVSSPTIKEYFQILEDTMVGYLLKPFSYTTKRKAVTTAKFYFFDNGVTNGLINRFSVVEGTGDFGKLLEQYIFLELKAYCGIYRKTYELTYWRTTNHDEIDFIVHDNQKNIIAIEVKAGKHPRPKELNMFHKFEEDFLLTRKIVVSTTPSTYQENDITIYSIIDFLNDLWDHTIF